MKESQIPHLDKAVGIPNTYPNAVEAQEDLDRILTEQFTESGGKIIPEYEIEKTEKDITLIHFAESALDDYLAKYNRKKEVDIPLENIHVLKEGGTKDFTHGRLANGAYSVKFGGLLADRSPSNVNFSLTLFHELVHAKSYNAAQITTGKTKEERTLEEFRSGFSVTSRDGKTVLFEGVNEAIVGLLTKRFFEDYMQKSALFTDELKDMEAKGTITNTSRRYEVTRGLEYINDIYERNKDTYTLQEIEDIFIDAGINGNLLKVGRLVEATFGKGSFRGLGKATGKRIG